MTDSEIESDIDDTVASITEQALKRIDEAFDRAISESIPEDERPQKRRRVEQSQTVEPAGGFILDSEEGEDVGGGFVLDDNDDDMQNINTRSSSSRLSPSPLPSAGQPTHIPLSLIPHALQLLDFDPSDVQVLSVFSNAASNPPKVRSGRIQGRARPSISKGSDNEDESVEPEQVVSRRDFRAVCAALLPLDSPSSREGSPSLHGSDIIESDSGSSDALNSADLEESESSEDEYIPDTKPKRSGRRAHVQRERSSSPPKSRAISKGKSKEKDKSKKKKRQDSNTSSSSPGKNTPNLSARQKQDTLAAFALFFPDPFNKGTRRSEMSEAELSQKRITIREVANAAAAIKQKITAEEIVEMLTFFSATPHQSQNNSSLSLHEFQQMMITAKLA